MDAISFVVHLFRNFNLINIFLANSSLLSLATSYPHSCNWIYARRYFYCNAARCKPAYSAPKKGGIGHYILFIISKENNSFSGRVFDSLNSITTTTHPFISALENIFSSSRSFSWSFPYCHPQNEYECGCRVIFAIAQFCMGSLLNLPLSDIFHCIQHVCNRPSDYSSSLLRQATAKIISGSGFTSSNNIWLHDFISSKDSSFHIFSIPAQHIPKKQSYKRKISAISSNPPSVLKQLSD